MVRYHNVYTGFAARLGLGEEEGVARTKAVANDGDLTSGWVRADGMDEFLYKRSGDYLFPRSVRLLISNISIMVNVNIGEMENKGHGNLPASRCLTSQGPRAAADFAVSAALVSAEASA